MHKVWTLVVAAAAVAVLVVVLDSAGVLADKPNVAGQADTVGVGPYLLLGEGNSIHVRWTVKAGATAGPTKAGVVVLEEKGGNRTFQGKPLAKDSLTEGLSAVAYDAELGRLEPCATYGYRLEPMEGADVLHKFRAPPPAGSGCPGGLKIGAYGDNRTGHKDHEAVVDRMLKSRWDLLLNVGDIVDFADHLEEWPKFFAIERALLASAPIVMSPGNHEFWGNARMGLALLKRYFGAGGLSGSGDRSFDFGPLHIVVLDLYFGLPPAEGGIEWLRKDLGAVPADRFKIVVLHEPPLTFGHHKPRAPVRLLRPVLEDLAVDVVLAGHSHNYEHFKVGPTHYVTVGGGGAPLHSALVNPVEKDQQFLVKAVSTHHFLEMELKGSTLSFKVIDTAKDVVLDEWKLQRQRPANK